MTLDIDYQNVYLKIVLHKGYIQPLYNQHPLVLKVLCNQKHSFYKLLTVQFQQILVEYKRPTV